MTIQTTPTPQQPSASPGDTAAILSAAFAAAEDAKAAAVAAAARRLAAEESRDRIRAEVKEKQADRNRLKEELKTAKSRLTAAKKARASLAEIDRAKKEVERLEGLVEEATAAIQALKAQQPAVTEAVRAAKREENRAVRGQTAHAAAAWQTYREAGAIETFTPGFSVGMPLLLDGVLRRQIRDSDLKPLEIRAPSRAIDSLAAKVLETFEEPNREAKKQVQELIFEHGLGTKMLAVTRRLDRRSMSEARRRVLAATYALSLRDLLSKADETSYVLDPSESVKAWYLVPSIEKRVSDAKSFSDAVILHQEQKPHPQTGEGGGPLHLFAERLTERVIAEAQIDVDDVVRGLLIRKVRASL